jgi:hypothetical protein
VFFFLSPLPPIFHRYTRLVLQQKNKETSSATGGKKKPIDPDQHRNAIVGKTLLTLIDFDPSLGPQLESQ